MKWFQLLPLAQLASAVGLLGVDYGAEFVKSSLVAPNSPFEVVLTPDSQRKDASGLVITPTDGERLYGSRGVPLQSKYPQASLYSVKSLLGIPYDDLRMALFQEMHPGLDMVKTSRNSIGFNISGVVYPVEEVVAMQLRDISVRSTDLLREKTHSKKDSLQGVAISVPGHFGSLQRQALVDSASLAGTELVGLVSDGVAVGINYANSPAAKLESNSTTYIVVYDLGASAASATLLGLKESENSADVDISVEGYGTDTLTSGHSLTLLLRELLLEKFGDKNLVRTPRLLNRVWREAERAKQVLSANSEVHVHMESLVEDRDLDVRITREEYEEQAEFQISRITGPLLKATANLPNGLDSVEAVVLVGGASRTPFVLETLKKTVGEQKLARNVNADEANVQGTSMRGINMSRLFRTKRQFNVNDAVTHDYRVAYRTSETTASEDTDLESQQLFRVGDLLSDVATVSLPIQSKTVHLLEGRKRIGTWDLPYTDKSLESLNEGRSCLDEPKLEAQFSIDKYGIVKLLKIEVKCKAQAAETTEAPSATDTVYSATASEASGSETTGSETAETTGTTSASSSGSKISTVARRVSIKPTWEQAPLGAADRAASKSRLSEMDARDGNRQEFSELHHQLETLAYKIRAITSSDVLNDIAHALLEYIEDGPGDLEELKSKLNEAREAYDVHTGAKQAKDEEAAKEEAEQEAEKEATEAIVDPLADDSLNTDEPDHNEPDHDEPNHDEL